MAEQSFNAVLRPIKREPISVSILNMVSESILAGRLKPGDKLPTELDLAEKLGVSRNSVREAIKMLASLGVIEVKRGAGTFISRSMPSSVLDQMMLSLAFHQGTSKELIEIRMMVEVGAAELAIDNATDEQIERLENTNLRLKLASQDPDKDSHHLRDLDLKIHFTLLEITNNPFVEKIGKTIYRLFFASIEDTVTRDNIKAYENHQLYIDAIKRRDKDLVRKRIKKALSYWMEYIEHPQKKSE